MQQKKLQSGYALLTAIILTATLVLVAYAVSNIALRQLTLTTTNVESHNAFYIADSGLECALFWDVKNPTDSTKSAFDPASPAASITCGGTTNTVTTTVSGGSGPTTNYALTGTVTSSGEYSANFPASSVINGDKRGVGWDAGGGWNDNTPNNWSNDWVAIAFPTARSINEINVYTLANAFPLASDPGPSDTFSLYGITSFNVQYSINNGGSWATVPGGNITGNNLIWRKITFTAIPGVTNIRVVVTDSLGSYSRIVEIEAWGGGGGGDSSVSNFQIPVSSSCATVTVTKNASGMTTIESRGYNTCGSGTRYERAIRISY